eukprot:2988383-Lingulodinium_polyedra.AAC.1
MDSNELASALLNRSDIMEALEGNEKELKAWQKDYEAKLSTHKVYKEELAEYKKASVSKKTKGDAQS